MSKATEPSAEEDIVASGEALRTVAGWLGVGDVDNVLEKEGLNPEFEMGRQQGLGLGAKFLPHHKAIALTSGVEQRLGSKLKRSTERRLAEEAQSGQHQHSREAALRHGFGGQHGQRHGKAARRPQQVHQPAGAAAQARGGADEDDDSEEEEGRGNAFGKGKHEASRQVAFNRSDLLRTSEAAHGKKRKRKKGGQALPPPAGT